MTQRDFYNAVVKANLNSEITTFALGEIAKLDTKNAKAKARKVELSKENEPIFALIREYFNSHKYALGSELGVYCKVSTPKAIAMAKKMVETGELTAKEVSIPKVGKRVAYSLAETE